MMPAELLQILTEIRDAFPFVKRRFNEAPRVVDEWTRALRPLAVSLVQDGISRWIRHSNIDPPLDDFLGLLDTIAQERQQKAARGPVVLETPRRAPADAVSVEEVKALLQDLYVLFDHRQAVLDGERRKRRGPTWQDEEGIPTRGAPPTCSLSWPMMTPAEAKTVQVQLLQRPAATPQTPKQGTA